MTLLTRMLAVLGNLAGGLGLVTVLRLLRSKDRLTDKRRSRTATGD